MTAMHGRTPRGIRLTNAGHATISSPRRTRPITDYPEINVPVTAEEAKRLEEKDLWWTGPRLVVLLLVTMSIVLTVLYTAATLSFDPSMGQ